MRLLKSTMMATAALLWAGSAASQESATPTWAHAAKIGIGASYEAYVDGAYRDGGVTGAVSRVWFSLADGVLTETMYGLIHEAQIKQLRFAVVTDDGLAMEGEDTDFVVDYLHKDAQGRPLSPAYRVTTTDRQGRFVIEKRVFTDPDRQALVLRVTIRALKGAATPYLLLEPHMANTGVGDRGRADRRGLYAHEGEVHLALRPSAPFGATSVGFVGVSDGLTGLSADGRLPRRSTTGEVGGDVMLSGALPRLRQGQSVSRDFVIGFGATRAEAEAQADGALSAGLDQVLARYNGQGDHVGWEDYVAGLSDLPRVAAQATDGGKLAYASALAHKVQEDRTHAGALIASLSNPWGDTVDASSPSTGYKAVWPRDFYQVAMALAALGDRETPLAALRYLPKVQVGPDTPGNRGAGGWFLQKTHVDGQPEWVAVQLDQTAMPIMLAHRLWSLGWLSQDEMKALYDRMLKPAADFLTDGGVVDIDWNHNEIRPPYTQQERWEEQRGYSPSTTAAVVAGLTLAGELAQASGDDAGAARYRQAADAASERIERTMFTTTGALGDGRYYVRITQNEDPNDKGLLDARNGQVTPAEDQVIDGGFLELARYGVRRADDPHVTATLPEYDETSLEALYRVRYDFGPEGDRTPGWRRYGVDGYGEDVETGLGYGAGGAMTPGQRGRVWPFFTGERGHYELARLVERNALDEAAMTSLRRTYVRGMERFANAGLMLPEQVWDGVGRASPHGYAVGEGTNSATPLAWTHAEYLKLLRSLADRAVWDRYGPVAERYAR